MNRSTSFVRRGLIGFALAACALAASATGASATVFEASAYPAEVWGSQTSESATFTAEAGLSVSCETSNLEGALAEAADEVAFTATFSGCSAFGFPTTISASGCQLVLHVEEEEEAESSALGGTADIVCAPGQAIKIVTLGCEVRIGSQSGLAAVEYANVSGPPGTVSANLALEDVAYEKAVDGPFCPLSGTGPAAGGSFGAAYELGIPFGGFVLAPRRTKLCKANEANCSAENTYPAKTPFKAVDEVGPELVTLPAEGAGVTLACTKSEIEGETTREEAPTADDALPIKLTKMTLAGCKANGVQCEEASYLGLPSAIGLYGGANGNGRVFLGVALEVSCGEVLRCRYVGGPKPVEPTFTGGEKAELKATELNMTRVPIGNEIGCAQSAKWTTKYTVSEPAPAYATW